MARRTAARSRVVVVLAADAVWDGLLGVAFCLMPWFGPYAALPAARPWPVFVLTGVACLVFSAVLAAGARAARPDDLARLAAAGNAGAAVAAAVAAALIGGPSSAVAALAVVAAGCAAFAAAEWAVARRARRGFRRR